MSLVATLICNPNNPALDSTILDGARAVLPQAGPAHWLWDEVAADIPFDTPTKDKDDIRAIAMRGEIEFEPALRERVALLKDMPVSVVDEVLAKRITPNPGGRELVMTMRAHGAYTCLISGGFTLFTKAVAARIGFQENRANELIVRDGKFTGEVKEPILGRATKLATLIELTESFDLDDVDTMVAGDGANDLGMIENAGLGVAYHAKPAVAAAAAARIDHGDLTALLYAQGYRREEFVDG
jgi:phosphoserine phosphatase